MLKIYTDGACSPQRVGGWAAVIVADGRQQAFQGQEEGTTNNRMEVMAAIKGLEATPAGAEVILVSDSQYLIYTMSRGWKRRANTDLWQLLDKLAASRKVRWEWQESHQGIPEAEEAHRLAEQMASMAATPSHPPPPTPPLAPARMVDVGEKAITRREAMAQGRVKMQPATLELIKQGKLAKGDVLAVAQVAGILAAKRTPDLIPLCHPLLIENTSLEFRLDEAASQVEVTATVQGAGKTGFEMEALVAVAVAALTIYDMVKAHDPRVTIEAIGLVRKSGGKSGVVELS